MMRKHDLAAAVLLAATVLIALLLRGLDAPLDFDEHYHIATIEQIRQQFPAVELNRTPAATPLLYHFMAAGIAGLMNENLLAARILTAFMAVGVLWGLYWLAGRKLQLTQPLWAVIVVALHPAILWYSSMAMTEVPSLFWAVLALVAISTVRPPWLAGLGAGISMAAAVWTRQTWVFLPLVLLIVVWRKFSFRNLLSDPMTLAGAIALLSAGALFIMWGGFAPPGEYASSHALALNLAQPLFGLAMIGLYLPVVALSWRVTPFAIAATAFVTILVCVPADSLVRVYLAGDTLTNPQGPLQGILNLVAAKVGHVPASVVCLALVVLGVLTTMRLILAATWNRAIAFTMLCVATLALLLLLVPQVWERYWSPAVPMTILASIRVMEQSKKSRTMIRLQYAHLICIGLAYFFWQLLT